MCIMDHSWASSSVRVLVLQGRTSFTCMVGVLISCVLCQVKIKTTLSTPDGILPCQASEDSILNYGQYEILSTRNFLCSAPTLNSTMDFSGKHVEDGVVDSPLEKKPRLPVSCSPSPLISRETCRLSTSPTASDKGMQRKLYGDANYAILEEIPQMPKESQANFAELHVVPLPRSRKYVLSTERYLKRKLVGPSRSHSSSSRWNSWEQRSLQAQQREHIHQEGSYDKGSYS